MIRSVMLDLAFGNIAFPKRVKILGVQGVLPVGDQWRFKSEDLSEKFVDASGNTFYMNQVRIGDATNVVDVFIDYKFENWNVLNFDYMTGVGSAEITLFFEDYE